LKWFKGFKKRENIYRSNEEWIKTLRPPPDEKTVDDLRQILVQGLKPALYKYIDRELNQFVEDTVQDAMIKILDKIHTFRGESKFVTWAIKIAVREGLSELRRKKWKDISIQDFKDHSNGGKSSEVNSLLFSTDSPDAERVTHENMVLNRVMEIIDRELSDKQKTAIKSLKIHEMPATVVAEQMGINRNALYKLVHDARVKLKKKMAESGMDPDDILGQL